MHPLNRSRQEQSKAGPGTLPFQSRGNVPSAGVGVTSYPLGHRLVHNAFFPTTSASTKSLGSYAPQFAVKSSSFSTMRSFPEGFPGSRPRVKPAPLDTFKTASSRDSSILSKPQGKSPSHPLPGSGIGFSALLGPPVSESAATGSSGFAMRNSRQRPLVARTSMPKSSLQLNNVAESPPGVVLAGTNVSSSFSSTTGPRVDSKPSREGNSNVEKPLKIADNVAASQALKNILIQGGKRSTKSDESTVSSSLVTDPMGKMAPNYCSTAIDSTSSSPSQLSFNNVRASNSPPSNYPKQSANSVSRKSEPLTASNVASPASSNLAWSALGPAASSATALNRAPITSSSVASTAKNDKMLKEERSAALPAYSRTGTPGVYKSSSAGNAAAIIESSGLSAGFGRFSSNSHNASSGNMKNNDSDRELLKNVDNSRVTPRGSSRPVAHPYPEPTDFGGSVFEPPAPSVLVTSEASAGTSLPNWINCLQEELDNRILVILRDSRTFNGYLRTFDQFGNIMLEDTKQQIVVGNFYGLLYIGCMLIRGDNIMLFAAIDPTKPTTMIEKGIPEILEMQRQEEERLRKERERLRIIKRKAPMLLNIEDIVEDYHFNSV